jgi:membrane protein required for colicin V production
VDIAGFQLTLFDLLVALWLFGFFLLGFVQGTIRRLLGTASIVFSFYFAALLKEPLGDFLGRYWTQFPREYGEMIGFLTVFGAATIAFSVVIQGTYRKTPLFEKAHYADEVLGGLLGVVQAALFLLFLTVVLDSFFRLTEFPVNPNELGFLRTFWDTLNGSATGSILHETAIPVLLALTGLFIPDSVKALYPPL